MIKKDQSQLPAKQCNIYVSITPQAWTRQELHNVLHGAHTFGRAWSNIARHYDFHKYHRNWLAISHQAKKLLNADLLDSAYKVRCRGLINVTQSMGLPAANHSSRRGLK